VKNGFPKLAVEPIIKAYPQALDVEDGSNCTPLDLVANNSELAIILERPVMCWLHHIHDDEKQQENDAEMEKLERDVHELRKDVAAELIQENRLISRLVVIEQHVRGCESVVNKERLKIIASKFQEHMKNEIGALNITFSSIRNKLKVKEESNDFKNKYMRGFISDTLEVYDELDNLMSEYEADMKNLRSAWNEKRCLRKVY